MITYDPKEAEKNVWDEADYEAVLMEVSEGTSKSSGNEMETWQIGVYHPDGREQTIKEYVTAKAAFKIKQLAIALGRRAEFDAGTFQAEEHVKSSFIVALTIERDDQYGDKNRISKFKAKAGTAPRSPMSIGAAVREKAQSKPKPQAPFEEQQFSESEIPF